MHIKKAVKKTALIKDEKRYAVQVSDATMMIIASLPVTLLYFIFRPAHNVVLNKWYTGCLNVRWYLRLRKYYVYD
jgi:hypothetical protein